MLQLLLRMRKIHGGRQFERLRRDPSLLPQAIEEILRWVSPVMQYRRTAICDTQIGDKEIRKGDKVVMYYGAANRDPRVFDNPEVFDITREQNRHIALSIGPHFCLGANLARAEAQVAIERLLARTRRIELATSEPLPLHPL